MQMIRFHNLLQKYIRNTPAYPYIVKNYFHYAWIDHIAHRSFNYQTLIAHYEQSGFRVQDATYNFPSIDVEAKWLKYDKNKDVYRIFVSQYMKPTNYRIETYEDYKAIQTENDYVAWTLLHRFDINHIAIVTNDIYDLATKLKKDSQVRLNQPEDPVKVSKDGKLLQMSTKADTIEYRFLSGEVVDVPYTFVEFIQRIDGRDGFESDNALQIFTSTDVNNL
jgi:hypothetical protein